VKPQVLVTQKVFEEALTLLGKHFSVESNQRDIAPPPPQFAKKLRGKAGAMILLTDLVDDRLLAQCPGLKIAANIAVG
jgi:gluconate 2-dehydrogenase